MCQTEGDAFDIPNTFVYKQLIALDLRTAIKVFHPHPGDRNVERNLNPGKAVVWLNADTGPRATPQGSLRLNLVLSKEPAF